MNEIKARRKPISVIQMDKKRREEELAIKLATQSEYIFVFEYIISLFYPEGARLIHNFKELNEDDIHFVMDKLKDETDIKRRCNAVDIAKYLTKNNPDFNKCLFLLYGKRMIKLETLPSFDYNSIYNVLDINRLDGYSSTYVKIEKENFYGGFDIMLPYFQSHFSFMKMKRMSFDRLVDNIKFENHAMRIYQNYDETYLCPK